MSSGDEIQVYVQSFIKIDSAVQKLIAADIHTDNMVSA